MIKFSNVLTLLLKNRQFYLAVRFYINIGVGMFDFIQNFIYSLVELQEKLLHKKAKATFKSSYSNKTSKKVFSNAASLELTSKTNQNKVKVENNVKTILKKLENNPEKLLKFVEKNGTKVYRIAHADKVLRLIGCEEGLISAQRGLKALVLNLFIKYSGSEVNITSTTEPMFVLRDLALEKCTVIQQFHKWYSMKLDLPGFDSSSQDNFQKFLSPANDGKIKDLSVEEILGLKEAIAREVEAINFVVDLAKSDEGSKNALKKIVAGGASV